MPIESLDHLISPLAASLRNSRTKAWLNFPGTGLPYSVIYLLSAVLPHLNITFNNLPFLGLLRSIFSNQGLAAFFPSDGEEMLSESFHSRVNAVNSSAISSLNSLGALEWEAAGTTRVLPFILSGCFMVSSTEMSHWATFSDSSPIKVSRLRVPGNSFFLEACGWFSAAVWSSSFLALD